MNPILFFLIVAILGTLAAGYWRMSTKPVAVVQVRRAAPPARRQAPLAAPKLETIEWTEPPAATGKRALETKLRNRYAAARFPGVFEDSGDKEGVERVIGAARRYFEEEKFDRAQELLSLAIARTPDATELRLAQIEIAFLMREPSLFTRLAAQFQAAHAGHPAWRDIARLGHAIAPDEPRFATHSGTRAHEHYGPWPDMPNWIGASWDLTSEVLAADFHRAMDAQARRAPSARLRHVA
jgi:hypothetical protein